MRLVFVAACLVSLTWVPLRAGDDVSQMDAHVHGHGILNIAVEGQVVEMELEAPGADIVGF